MLDDSLKQIDHSNMYDKIVEFPKQLIDGIEIGRQADLKDLVDIRFKSIVLAGMGGSAIAGDLLKSVLLDDLKIPFEVNRNYGLSPHIAKDSLVVCSSYSGNTEETLSAFEAAYKRGCKILCISTGGKLSHRADKNGIALIKIPTGFNPREALGYSFTPFLIVLGRLNLIRDYSSDIQNCAASLEGLKDQYLYESKSNRAIFLAEKLAGKIIIIYSGPDKLNSTALRFKGQFCENSKQLVFCNVFPEFNHNELVGWELSSTYTDKFIVLFLSDKDDHIQISRRIEAVKGILTEKKVEFIELKSKGDDILTRIFYLLQIADFTSYYMALINGVDPSPVKLIDYLKEYLADKKKKEDV